MGASAYQVRPVLSAPRVLSTDYRVRFQCIRVPPPPNIPKPIQMGVGVLLFCGPSFRERGFWNDPPVGSMMIVLFTVLSRNKLRIPLEGTYLFVVEQCVVNERVPLFALKLDKQEVTPATTFASREEGGVCHMQRLMQVNNHLPQFDSGYSCLLYTSPSPRDRQKSRMPSSA